jgi:hypothetical protein
METFSATSSSSTNWGRSSASGPGAECGAFAGYPADGWRLHHASGILDVWLDSKWLIENRGVQPDVVVDNPPDLVLKGQDPQLEKAVEMLMEQIKANPKKTAGACRRICRRIRRGQGCSDVPGFPVFPLRVAAFVGRDGGRVSRRFRLANRTVGRIL